MLAGIILLYFIDFSEKLFDIIRQDFWEIVGLMEDNMIYFNDRFDFKAV
jgi:hypothetical protein